MEGHLTSKDHGREVESAGRFDFGLNWTRFLELVNAERIERAERSLADALEVEDLKGKRFLDVGCGSGLFSLAAHRLGAAVRSFDYDPRSAACTRELKRRFAPEASDWVVEEGSVLDSDYLGSLGKWDVVYSWGVLHHTGAMWEALENVCGLVAPGGKLFIALYNDQGRASRRWLMVKKAYNALPSPLRWIILLPAFLRLWGPTFVRDALSGRPFSTWSGYAASGRGMSPWRDVVDWVGGLPFEVSRPEEVFDFCRRRGFTLLRLATAGGGHGCNEFVFERNAAGSAAAGG